MRTPAQAAGSRVFKQGAYGAATPKAPFPQNPQHPPRPRTPNSDNLLPLPDPTKG